MNPADEVQSAAGHVSDIPPLAGAKRLIYGQAGPLLHPHRHVAHVSSDDQGGHRDAGRTALAIMQLDDALSAEATRILATMFTSHGVAVVAQGDDLAFPRHPHRACASVFTEPGAGGRTSVQLDLRFVADDGQVLVESFAGFGDTVMDSVHNAAASMAQSSLHVILHAFFGCACDQVDEERWAIAGQPRRVTLGLVTGRGDPPPAAMDPGLWFPTLVGLIQSAPLTAGTHWVRFFYAHLQRRLLACEVLVDNDEMSGWQTNMSSLPWPATDGFYSRRWFVIIRDAQGG